MRKRPPRKYPQHQNRSKAKTTLRTRKSKSRGVIVFILLAIFGVLIYAFFTGNKSVLKLYSLRQQKNELITEKERLLSENQQLQEEIKKLQSDKRYIEEVARKKYNLQKPNEEVIIVKAQ